MARVDMAITFGERTLMYEGGERVDGVVTVRVHEKTQCKGLDLQIGWRTTGYGNSAGHVGFERSLFAGQWAPGEYRYDFNVMAPHGPNTYRGHSLNLDGRAGSCGRIGGKLWDVWFYKRRLRVELARGFRPHQLV